jgi:hypothetical protein
MAQKKGSGRSKSSKTAATTAKPRRLPQGSVHLDMTSPTGSGNFPAFMAASSILAGEADVSDDLGGLAPTFGNVLNSIGVGVATSQEALDQGLVEVATTLSDTKIDLVTQVIQELDEDGLPVPPTDDSNLRKQSVSLINFVNPQAHQWQHVALSMDMSVGAMDNETGMQFNSTQTKSSASATGLLWGFVGWFQHSSSTRETSVERSTDQEAAWAQGQVRMDALLTPRRTGKFPVPAEVSIGPQIAIGLGGVTENDVSGVITRSQDLTITVRTAGGAVNPDKLLSITSNSYAIELLDNGAPSFNNTNAEGIVMARVKRRIPNAIFGGTTRGNVTVELGQISKDIQITL